MPVDAGSVNVAVTASVGCSVVLPEVAPFKTTNPIYIPYKITNLLVDGTVNVATRVIGPVVMAFLPAVVFLIMAPLRGYKVTGTTFEEFSVLVVKFGILHLLLQFSGFYSNVFPPK